MRLRRYLLVVIMCTVLASGVLCDSQLDALNAFYSATEGVKWKTNTGWGRNQDPCAQNSSNSPWYGLGCSGGWVIQISLQNNAIGGTLPSSLMNLLYLEKLDLGSNLLIGSIPDALVSAPSLTYVDLSNNHLQGGLPSFGANNTGFNTINLAVNQLQGTIPESFFNLHSLQTLDLSSNSLSGTISPHFADLSLTIFSIFSNGFTGQMPLSVCKAVLICDAAFNVDLMCPSMSCTCGAMQCVVKGEGYRLAFLVRSCNCNKLCLHNVDCIGLCTTCVGATPYLNGYCKGRGSSSSGDFML